VQARTRRRTSISNTLVGDELRVEERRPGNHARDEQDDDEGIRIITFGMRLK